MGNYMNRVNYARRISYLSLQSKLLQPHPLTEVFERLKIEVITPEDFVQAIRSDKPMIVLMDYKENCFIFPAIAPANFLHPRVETVLFNVQQRLHTETLLQFGNLKGLFYCNESIDKIELGLSEIINGQNWLPRQISNQLLYYYRHIYYDNPRKTVELTNREIQILRCLQTGRSNMQMAEELFISEFTVKSHLYQIFKKLMVKNRHQAIAWANHHLL